MLEEFYPTPKRLLEKVFEGTKWYAIESVLEPSAGKGDIADFMVENEVNQNEIDCIELEPVVTEHFI